MDWNDPVARYSLIERVGPDEYNRLIQQHFERSTIAVVNGHGIRTVGSRFGLLYWVDDTQDPKEGVGYLKREQAEAHANSLPTGKRAET